MGNVQTISQSVKLEQISKHTIEEYNKNVNETNTTMTQLNDQRVDIGSSINCTIKVNQTALQDGTVQVKLDQQAMFNRKDQVKEDLKTAAGNEINSKFESWGTTWGTKSKVKSDVSTIIEDIVEETWTNENINQTTTDVIQISSQEFKVGFLKCYKGQPPITIDQNATQTLVVNSMLNQIVEKASENEKIRSLQTTSDAKNILDVKGTLGDAGRAISSIVGSIGDIIGGPLMSFVVFAGIALIVALGVFLMLGQSPAGQNAIRSASGGGAGPTQF